MQELNALMPVNAFLECEGKSFRIKSGQVTEAICRSFDAQLSFSTDERHDAETFLGKFCTLSIEDAHGEKRTWVGECQTVTSSTDDGTKWHYIITFESILGRLKNSKVHFRTEAEVNLKDWVKATFKRHNINTESLDWRCHFDEVRPRLIQVQQSDYDYLLKILAQENIVVWPSTDKLMINFASNPAQWTQGPIERIFYTSKNTLIQYGGERIGVFDYEDIYQHARVPDDEDEKDDWENKPPERLYSGVPYILEGMGGPALKPCKHFNYDRKSMEALFRRRLTSEQEANSIYRYIDAKSNAIVIAVGHWISLVNVYKDEEIKGRITYVRHELISSGKTLRYKNRMLLQPAMSPWRAVSPLKQKLPLVMQAYIEGADNAPLLNQFGEERVSFPGDAADKPVPFEIPRMRSFVNHQGGMSFPLGHRTEVLISFLYGEADLPIIVGAVPNSDTPSPVNQSNPYDNILSTRSGHKLRLNDEPGKESVELQTSPTHGMFLQNGKGISLRSEGGFVLDVKNRILCQIGKSWNMLAGGSMNCTGHVSQTFETTEGDIVMSTPLDVDIQVKKQASLYIRSNMKMREKNFQMKVAKDATITIRNGETRLQIKGAVSIQGSDGIKIVGRRRIVIQSGDEGSGMIMEPGHITLYGKNLVGFETNELALNGNVSFGSAQRVSSPIQPLKNAMSQLNKKDIILHQISVPKQTNFYSEIILPEELDNFFFYIAPERMSVDLFITSLFDMPSEIQEKHFYAANPHIRGMIEPGQIVYIVDTSSNIYNKIKPGLDYSANAIESLRIQVPTKEYACFAYDFALLGSFSRSVGTSEDVYTAKPENLDKMTFADSAGIVTSAAHDFFEFSRREIKAIEEGYKRQPAAIKELREELIKRVDKASVQMLDKLVKHKKISREMMFEAGVELNKAKYSMTYAVKHWTTTAIRLESLDVLYADSLNVLKLLKTLPPVLIYLDYKDTKNKIYEACTKMREEECRKHSFVKWSGFAGSLAGGEFVSRLLGIGIAFAAAESELVTGGMSTAILASAIKIVITGMSEEQARKSSEKFATKLYEFDYERN